ncbi:hypothetical protein IGI04_041417 [Brassica rapa subsp. trilocularis]|uniref:Aldose 1-epimerase n=1 Tax=Brassica rapa subsp. trilocularis TaxID=1813537 RepID=A0ABQ7KUS1_BRACM|nr:hypothetical protein IGI04_041417 [Brassica rapa subsp. trilocularis]
MARVSLLLCLVILVTLGVVVTSFANNVEVQSEQVESSKKVTKAHHISKDKEKGGKKVNGDHNARSDGKENKKDEKKKHDVHKKEGKSGDIVLGYDSVESYETDKVYFGATVGRVANRIGKAHFKLNGKEYKTVANDGKNTLHGGKKGFGDVVWAVTKHKYDGKKPHIVFTYTSPDGFPGELIVTVRYKLVKDNKLSVVMEAKAKDKATPVNLAHHTYWNLGGHNSGDILSEEIQILGSSYTPVDGELIPTGKISPVKRTPYDFLQPRPIKDNMKDLKTGYDINYCLDGKADKMRKIVELVDKKSGRKMELSANQPGLQFYTGGMLKDIKGKNGTVYQAFAGLCLETQSYPDSVNNPKFPSQIVEPGKNYKHNMLFKFSIVS